MGEHAHTWTRPGSVTHRRRVRFPMRRAKTMAHGNTPMHGQRTPWPVGRLIIERTRTPVDTEGSQERHPGSLFLSAPTVLHPQELARWVDLRLTVSSYRSSQSTQGANSSRDFLEKCAVFTPNPPPDHCFLEIRSSQCRAE